MFQVIRTRNKEIMDVQSCFLSTTLQIWCYCGHVVKSRTRRHLNFDCHLNLSKSRKGLVIITCVVSAQCTKVWLGGGEKRPPCEIGLTYKLGGKSPPSPPYLPPPSYSFSQCFAPPSIWSLFFFLLLLGCSFQALSQRVSEVTFAYLSSAVLIK